MKNWIEFIIRRLKKTDFRFDKDVSIGVLTNLIISKIIQSLRGLKFYRFKQRGKLVFLGKKVYLQHTSKIYLGNNIFIGDYTQLSGLGKGTLTIGNNTSIGSHSKIIISTSYHNLGEFIRIGDNVGIGEFSYIGGGGGTIIGDETIIGQYFSIHPENHNYSNKNISIRFQGVTRVGVEIGKNCWIGAKVTITDGVKIGNNCVIAAGSVVTKSFPPNQVIGGIPAKVLKVIK